MSSSIKWLRYYSFDADDASTGRVVHTVVGCVSTVVVATLASPPWAWLVGSIFILAALFWPYLIMSMESMRDAVVRTLEVAVACVGVTTVAKLAPSAPGWAWLTAGAGITIAITWELWLKRHRELLATRRVSEFDVTEINYSNLVLAGLVTGVVGTTSFSPTPSWAWLAAAVLTLTVAVGEVWDHLARGLGFIEYKIKFVAGTAVLTVAVAFATVHFPLPWIWIATPVLVLGLLWKLPLFEIFYYKNGVETPRR